MINSRPNNSKYNGGNYIPTNISKLIKANKEGGVYYRSSWELRIMKWLDLNPNIIKWGAECISVHYQQKNHLKDEIISNHRYYPDFYYEIVDKDGNVSKVLAEVKPQKEYDMTVKLFENTIEIPSDATLKKMKNLQYDIKMAQKNYEKWTNTIKWCEKKGYKFIIITENTLKQKGLLK